MISTWTVCIPSQLIDRLYQIKSVVFFLTKVYLNDDLNQHIETR
jgi:hypothetical protein